MLWFNESREQIKTDNPGISFVDIAKKGGEIWKKLSSSDKAVSNFLKCIISHNLTKKNWCICNIW